MNYRALFYVLLGLSISLPSIVIGWASRVESRLAMNELYCEGTKLVLDCKRDLSRLRYMVIQYERPRRRPGKGKA